MTRRWCCLLLASAPLFARSHGPHGNLAQSIDRLVNHTPALASAFVGIEVVSLRNDRVLYAHDANHLFTPASNMKLFTTALALMRLGPEYRFKTSISAAALPGPDGALHGDLVIVGGGDPSLSPRNYPFIQSPAVSAPAAIAPIEQLADQIVARGIRSIDGGIVGDESRYVFDPYPGGWAIGDLLSGDAAPVSALIVNDNSLALSVQPGTNQGDPAQLTVFPPLSTYPLVNHVHTVQSAPAKITVHRVPGSGEVEIAGTIAANSAPQPEELGVSDAAVFAADMLADALSRRGVVIHGHSTARHLLLEAAADPSRAPAAPAGIEIASRLSPPLAELLEVTDKVSQNLHAETMLREVAAVEHGYGSVAGGLASLATFLSEVGIGEHEYEFRDGSGLSRASLVTPDAVVKLLRYMYRSKYREQWFSMLPIGGVDGTLSKRFAGHPEASAIHAKTGTLSHVRALSGYAESRHYGPLVFSILVNNATAPGTEITGFIDTIGLKLLQ